MGNEKSISVIIPVYNASKYLKDCLDSIVCQLEPDDELIIVNDGSTDDSDSICKSFESEYNNVKYIRIANSGVSTARNIGMDNSNADWICFVDADDKLSTGSLKHAKEQMSDEIDAIYYNHMKNTETLSFSDKSTDISSLAVLNFTLDYFSNKKEVIQYMTSHSMLFSACWAKLFRRRNIQHHHITFSSKLKLSEDTCFCIEYLQCCNKVRLCDKYFYWYRLNSDSVTQKKNISHLENRKELFDYLQNYLFEKEILKYALSRYIVNIILQTNQIVSMIDDDRAIKIYKELIYREDVHAALYNVCSTVLSDGNIQNRYYKIVRFLLMHKKVGIAVIIGKYYRKFKQLLRK